MTPTIALLLIITFLLSTVGLLLLIWSIATNQFSQSQAAARTIFSPGEEGHSEDPALEGAPPYVVDKKIDDEAVNARWLADHSSKPAVLTWLTSAVIWLLIGSMYGLFSSIKMHYPEFLADSAWWTFGRIRPMHLNAVTYGWASMAGIGVILFLIPRLFKTPVIWH
ncbi:MAG: cbb3-type cytochrome c oxidase subunit I [Oceanisphaera sp.]